jgi:hypothetical protein
MGALARSYIVRVDARGSADEVEARIAAVVRERLGF